MHPDDPGFTVGVVGCGAMGQGIAQVSAQGGMRTLLFDMRDGGASAAREAIAARINRMAEKGRVTEADATAAIDRMEVAPALSDLAPCHAVVEAIFEDLDAKQALFKDLEGVLSAEALIASNTSSIPIASIARGCEIRGRIGGLHFFNPVPLMKLVEVIRAAQTSDETVARLMTLGRRMTRVPVEVKDSPGFLVNMGGRAYTTEALRIAHEGVATPEQVDAIMRDCWGFRMGPFELMDLTGIDVNYPVSRIIAGGYMDDARLRTSPNHTAMFDAGLYGRKAGRGWYAYEGGKPLDRPSADVTTQAEPVTSVRLLKPKPELEAFCAELGLTIGAGPILAAPTGEDTTATAVRNDVRHTDLVCLDLSGDVSKRVTMMTAPGADRARLEGVAAAIIASGRAVTWISDSPGFVGQRMVAMVANLGCYMAEIGLASPEDIDTAMQLGLNYPRGSIALGEYLGGQRLYDILYALHDLTGEDRYRATQWLRRRAHLGLSLYTPN